MSNWEQRLLNEVREDVKAIREALPNMVTKEDHERLEKRVDKHGFIFNAIVWVGGTIWALFQGMGKIFPHG